MHFTPWVVILLAAAPGLFPPLRAGPPALSPATRPANRASIRPLTFADCDDREYPVFSALLARLYANGKGQVPRCSRAAGQPIRQVALSGCTQDCRWSTTDPDTGEPEEFFDESRLGSASLLKDAPPELEKVFLAVNRRPARLDVHKIRVEGVEIIPIAQEEYSGPKRPDHFHPNLFDRFPQSQGVSILSRPAFTHDGNVAIVSISTSEGQFGYGMIYLLRRTRSGWEVIDGRLSWIT